MDIRRLPLVESRRLQTVQEGDGAPRMGSGREDRPLVIGEDFEPRRQVSGMVGPGLEFRRDAEIGAEEAAPEFGDQLLARPLVAILGIAAEIAVDAVRPSGPMRGFVAEDRDIRRGVAEALEGRHLDDVERGA